MRKINFEDVKENICIINLFLVNFLDNLDFFTKSSENIYYKINETNIDDSKFDMLITDFKDIFNKFISALNKLSEKQLTNCQSVFYVKITESDDNDCSYLSTNPNQDKVINEYFNLDIWEVARSKVFNKICFELNNNTEYVLECPRIYFNYHPINLNLTCKIIKNFSENDITENFQIVSEISESLVNYGLNSKIIIFGNMLAKIKDSTKDIKSYIETILNELKMINNSYEIINL